MGMADAYGEAKRDEQALQATKREKSYPHWNGDFRILGPGVFADADLNVVNVNGENYTRQANPGAPIDPGDVRVGDVVEIEADDGSWMVRGTVAVTRQDGRDRWPLLIGADVWGDDYIRPCVEHATVRLLQRTEPEPDPEQVEALRLLLAERFDGPLNGAARELVRHGVTVGGERR